MKKMKKMRKMNRIKRITSCVLALMLLFNIANITFAADERAKTNVALGKTATCSGVEKNSSGVTTDFTADKVVDGDKTSAASRWSGLSSRTATAEEVAGQWVEVNLEQSYSIDEVRVYLRGAVQKYIVQVSKDGIEYSTILTVEDGIEDKAAEHVIKLDEAVNIQYIKFQAQSVINASNGVKYSASVFEIEAYENSNVALGKTATCSGVEKNSSGVTTDFTADKVVDGDKTSAASRWSGLSSRTVAPEEVAKQWVEVDLGAVYTLEEIRLYLNGAVQYYAVQVSKDGTDYSNALTVGDGVPDAKATNIIVLDEPTEIRYIKFQAGSYISAGNGIKYSASVLEIEAYQYKITQDITSYDSASDVLAALGEPTISNGKLVLPESPSAQYKVSLFGCDNKQIIADNLTITQPLVDMPVNILYKVEHISNADDTAVSRTDIKFTVPGIYTTEADDNAKPNVVPGLREWKGHTGSFTLSANSKIVISDSSLASTAGAIQFYFKEMLGITINITTGQPSPGDIYLRLDSTQSVLGDEGYMMAISDYVTIVSPAAIGLQYGGISITQIMYQSSDLATLPKGLARDYPKYAVRAGMIDVGRMYIPLEYLQEMTIYMSWFKMNEIQVHVNDYWGNSGYQAFRLESEVYPEIVAKDGYYTKDEYRRYQKDMKRFGIDVITEIDTPYHSECFRSISSAVMLSAGALDIREKSTYDIIENLFDEYLDGENPVIQSKNFHIGTDEYNTAAAYKEEMRRYTDHFINYVNNKGYQTRLWGSLGGGNANFGFDGNTPVSTDATMNLWAPYWSDVEYTFELGYDIINTNGYHTYIVPGANAGYPDRIDLATRYDDWSVNNFYSNRYSGNGSAVMQIAHPRLVGASFAIWNDMTSFKGGVSDFDIFDRMRNAVMLLSEKTWYGEKTEGQTSDEFVARTNALQNVVPGANPGRYVESKTDVIASYDFSSINNNTAQDGSGNGYSATLVNANKNDTNGIFFDGSGYMQLPMNSVGFPYTVSADFYIEKLPVPGERLNLFSGKDGSLYLFNSDGQTKIGYSRGEEGIAYEFAYLQDTYNIQTNQWINLTFTASGTTAPSATTTNGAKADTVLYIDGIKIGNASQTTARVTTGTGNGYRSTTFVLPVEKIMEGVKGGINNFKIFNYTMTPKDVALLFFGAEHFPISDWKPVTADSVQAGNEIANVNDGDTNTRWAANDGNFPHYFVIDLEETAYIADFNILPYGDASRIYYYNIQTSTDGVNYDVVVDRTTSGCLPGSNQAVWTKDVAPEGTLARYIKVYFNRATGGNASVWEFIVQGFHFKNTDYAIDLNMRTISGISANTQVDTLFDKVALKGNYKDAYIVDGNGFKVNSVAVRDGFNLIVVDENDQKIAFKLNVESWALKEILLNTINEAEALVGSDEYNKTYAFIREYFDASLNEAKAVYNKAYATDDEMVDAWAKLADAIHYLKAGPANMEKLAILADLADDLDLTRYNVGVEAFESALASAKNVLADMFASQDEVDSAYNALLKAITAMRYEVDKSKLQELYNKVNGVDASLYTAQSVLEFINAREFAARVLDDPGATQEIVNLAHDKLHDADKNLMALDGGSSGTDLSSDPSKPSDSNTDNNSKAPAGSSAPKTGDYSSVVLTVLVIGLAGVMIIVSKRRRTF